MRTPEVVLRAVAKRAGFGLLLILLWIFVSVEASAYGVPRPSGLPDNSSVRRSFEELLFASLPEIRNYSSRVELDPESGIRVQFNTAEQNGAFYLMFLNRRRGEFPVAGAGNWIIKRAVEDGSFLQAKVFLQNTGGTFARLFPSGEMTTMDVFLEGVLIHKHVPVRMRFKDVLLRSFSQIMDATRFLIDWSVLVPQEHRYSDTDIVNVAQKIRKDLPLLTDSDDGALDADGKFRFIEDLSENPAAGLNCSGFAKWVVDGILYPVAGEYLKIEDLKRKHLQLRGNAWSEALETQRDPYFGLDWTRNLAVSFSEARSGISGSAESADVRSVRIFTYREDIGYSIADLSAILYFLALDRPGSIFLGSVNREYGSAPVLRQHVHVVVLFPYFDDEGTFRVEVMERNFESTLTSLAKRYPGDFIHLVEIPVDGRFEPLGLRETNSAIPILTR